ncbi:hypothetical protein [Streptomyces synnematoformans]|uniref:Uncharacterized protein n=1 Tax=Streptomyces synnematoformans TaxID=415721 RepID=A0ABN2XAQ8_9ACTN
MTGLPDFLISYVAERDAARHAAVDAFLARLTDRERALMREAAVMAYVHGRQHPRDEKHPEDSHVLAGVIEACLAMPDLYPTIHAVSNEHPGEDVTDRTPACTWPACLPEDQQQALAEAVHSEMTTGDSPRGGTRCPSCEHGWNMHTDPAGCWFTVAAGKAGENLVCACSRRPLTDAPGLRALRDAMAQAAAAGHAEWMRPGSSAGDRPLAEALVDAVLPAVHAELARVQALHDDTVRRLHAALADQVQRREAAEQQTALVRTLHRPVVWAAEPPPDAHPDAEAFDGDITVCAHCSSPPDIRHHWAPWPCETVRAFNGDDIDLPKERRP